MACVNQPCAPIGVISTSSVGPWGLGAWGGSPWGGTGPSTTSSIVGGGTPYIISISPESGPTTGNTEIVIVGTELACFNFDDRFTDAILDTALWTTIGGGIIIEAPYGPAGHLKCSTGAVPGTSAGLRAISLRPVHDFNVEVGYHIQTEFLSVKPSSEIVLACMTAECDALNYFSISLVMKGPSEASAHVRCETWKAGANTHVFEAPISSSNGTLGLTRYFDPVFNDWKAAFWVSGTKIYECFDCPEYVLDVSFQCANGAAAYDLETWFENFRSKATVVALFPGGAALANSVVDVSDLRLRVKMPATVGNWAGAVDVRVSNGSGNGCYGTYSSFTYEGVTAFAVGRTEPFKPTRKEVSIKSDPVLRNPGQSVGLGLWRQL